MTTHSLDLPGLTDKNPAIIPIAETDRLEALGRLEAELRQAASGAMAAPAELVDEMVALYREVALRHTDAAWWLNINSRPVAPAVRSEILANPADKDRLAAIAGRR